MPFRFASDMKRASGSLINFSMSNVAVISFDGLSTCCLADQSLFTAPGTHTVQRVELALPMKGS